MFQERSWWSLRIERRSLEPYKLFWDWNGSTLSTYSSPRYHLDALEAVIPTWCFCLGPGGVVQLPGGIIPPCRLLFQAQGRFFLIHSTKSLQLFCAVMYFNGTYASQTGIPNSHYIQWSVPLFLVGIPVIFVYCHSGRPTEGYVGSQRKLLSFSENKQVIKMKDCKYRVFSEKMRKFYCQTALLLDYHLRGQ